jgi:hypothetical protein
MHQRSFQGLYSWKNYKMLAEKVGFKLDKIIFGPLLTPFTHSEIYSKDISSIQFLTEYAGEFSRLF